MSDQHSSLKLVRAGLLIDGSGNPPLENAAILINGSEIAAVGPQKEEVFDGFTMQKMKKNHHNEWSNCRS